MQQPELISMAEASRLALDRALEIDDGVVLLGEDIGDRQGGGVYKVTKGLSTKYGDHRVRTTPISEQAIVGAGIGLAIAGMRPVAEIMLMNFLTISMDQLVNHAAKMRYMTGSQTNVPLTIRTAAGAGVGSGAQHSDMLEAWFAHTPGLKVVIASTPAETVGLLQACIFDDDPCVFIEKKERYSARGAAPTDANTRIPLSKANIVRPGSDATAVAYGSAVNDVVAVAEELAPEGIDLEVIDLRTISPWDEGAVLDSVARTKRALVVHEAVLSFGVGAEISSRIHEELFSDLEAPVRRVASADVPVPFAPTLEKEFLYSNAEIESAVRSLVS